MHVLYFTIVLITVAISINYNFVAEQMVITSFAFGDLLCMVELTAIHD